MAEKIRPSAAQAQFLRKLRKDPTGLPADEWPSAVVLRRWMRQPGFCAAINSLRSALFVRTDMHLVAAAQNAAQALHRSLSVCNTVASNPSADATSAEGDEGAEPATPPADAMASLTEQRTLINSLVHLLRLAHARHREGFDIEPSGSKKLQEWKAQKSKAVAEMVERRKWRIQGQREKERSARRSAEKKKGPELAVTPVPQSGCPT